MCEKSKRDEDAVLEEVQKELQSEEGQKFLREIDDECEEYIEKLKEERKITREQLERRNTI